MQPCQLSCLTLQSMYIVTFCGDKAFLGIVKQKSQYLDYRCCCRIMPTIRFASRR